MTKILALLAKINMETGVIQISQWLGVILLNKTVQEYEDENIGQWWKTKK